MIPVLETERLVLRAPREDDFEAAAAFMASERARFVGGPVADRWNQWRGFLGSAGHWLLKGYGSFTVTLKDGTRVGRVGLINHVMWPEPELGWHLYEGFEGKGYATEAAIAARTWAWQAHGLGPLVSFVAPENAASRRLAERLGATVEREDMLLGAPCLVYRHPDPEAA